MLLTEYLAFAGSIGWLVAAMMAAILPSLPGEFGRRHAGWLFAFCVTRILAEGMMLAVFSAAPEAGGAFPGEMGRSLAAIASGMVLWEFARRLWNDQGRRRIHAGTHLVAAECLALLLAVALPLGNAARPAWFSPVALFAAVLPGALGFGATLLLWRCLGREPDASRRTALRTAALGFGAFALFSGMPGLSAGEALPPWIAVGGLGFASVALPAARTRFTAACAIGLLLAVVVGPYAIGGYVDAVAAAQLDGFQSRGQAAAAPWQGRPAATLGPATPAAARAVREQLEKLRGTDPLLRSAALWKLAGDRVLGLDVPGEAPGRWVSVRAATAAEQAGVARARIFVVATDAGQGERGVVVVHVPLRAASFETPAAWLALEYPDAFWAAQRGHARRSGLALCAALAAFCAAGFVLAVRHALENAQQLAVERAQSADRAKTEFLAFLSHEMRTPLQTILGRAELVRRENPGAARHADAIETQGIHLLRLVNDLLDLGTIEAGKLKLQPASFALRALLASLEETHGPVAAAKGLTLDIVVAPNVTDQLIGDEARLRQILGNLLGNAVKYTTRGNVTLDVSRGPASSPSSALCPLLFTVTDTGPGLPPEKIPQLFTLFTRLDSGGTFTREGTGVGLALVRRLCDLMGGTVAAANRADGGAAFTVRLIFPLAEPAPALAPAPAPLAAGALRVLVAEDNNPTREFLAEALAALGHRVEAVGDGDAALAACTARAFDAVILDINLPGRDGIALARALSARTPRPRLVGCSAEAFAATREAALAAGMDVFLEKPVTIAALAAALAPAAPPPAAASLFERLRAPELAAQARAALVRDLPAALAVLCTAHHAGDTPSLQRHAHHLRSSALLANDDALAELCLRLELAAAAGGGPPATTIIEALTRHAVPGVMTPTSAS